eukprot:3849109-Amphidinium_carterae.1
MQASPPVAMAVGSGLVALVCSWRCLLFAHVTLPSSPLRALVDCQTNTNANWDPTSIEYNSKF